MGNQESSTPSPPFELGSFCIDEPRPIKVIAIGAGYSGIIAGIRFRQRIQNLDLAIYDSNAEIGGTWFVNKYPGLACDIPSHCYQLTFEENTNWSSFYSPGPEIKAYLEGVVDKYKLRPHIKLEHRVIRAQYNETTGKWHVTIRRRIAQAHTEQKQNVTNKWDDWEEFEDIADVLFGGVGGLSRWAWPDIEGLENFTGPVIHSANWETGEGNNQGWEETIKSWGDKSVGVIGVGSSAIQIVPSLQPRVKQVVNYVRSQTWVSTVFSKENMLRLSGGVDVDNYEFTAEDKEKFKDPKYYKEFRRDLESSLNHAHTATILGTPLQVLGQQAFKDIMLQKLAKKPWIADHIIPDFAIACRRLTPGPGYLEALCEDNVEFITSGIKKVTPGGIETVDGKFQELDVIVCATGYNTTFQLDFSIIGRGGIDLNSHHTPHPRTYLSIAVDGFPNYFQCLGPNSGVGAGSLLLVLERQVDYAVAATAKLQRERLKSMEVKKQAVDDFDEFLMSYFPITVFGGKCHSWYKAGKEEGRVVALWPGSSLHTARALKHPRWEDFDYEPLDGIKNRFHWFGDGNTLADKDPNGDRAWYLTEEEVDIPPVPS